MREEKKPPPFFGLVIQPVYQGAAETQWVGHMPTRTFRFPHVTSINCVSYRRTSRNPMLLLRLFGLLLFRLDTVEFEALLFQLPPRLTRFVPEEGLPNMIPKAA